MCNSAGVRVLQRGRCQPLSKSLRLSLTTCGSIVGNSPRDHIESMFFSGLSPDGVLQSQGTRQFLPLLQQLSNIPPFFNLAKIEGILCLELDQLYNRLLEFLFTYEQRLAFPRLSHRRGAPSPPKTNLIFVRRAIGLHANPCRSTWCTGSVFFFAEITLHPAWP